MALAILLFGAVLFGDELRHQRHGHVVAGRDDGRGQHGMVALDLAVGALAGQTVRAAKLLRAEIFGSVQGDQRASAEALERRHAAVIAQGRDGLIERALQMRRVNRIEHRADVIVGRDLGHAEQSLAVGGLAAFVERPLIGQKRLRLHEKQRKRRQADVRHGVDARILPLVGKGGANIFQSGQKTLENQHLDLESESRVQEN